ncbi:hypothetical protein BU26DRAFT_573006 [Trematosphaeria pertusa]|uniref:PD-(D/E)XK nuclease-like domain-containing protein n=1 Tax=Trematosphaeria pertusa TaxID=390896 RepID=A0A6A6HQ14_9PLEO|nr:uncharacterized protein BU26DRAFT_573006 [Trematosphaeria pertusa]KAF2240216.1 hypothetical protein BU26DRAFT_573006 [Trematosphaeria pertusa]
MAGRRQPSPEKRQRVEEGIMPGESASIFSGHPLDLGQHNTFSPLGSHVGSRWGSRPGTGASSPRRGISPSRETIATLKDALPPIQTEPFDGAQLPVNRAIRDKVMAAMERLEPGRVDGWVPRCLQEAIISDNALGVQTFDRHAFIDSPRNLSECDLPLREELQYTLKKVKQIYQRARTCKTRGRDENAWCQVVIQPLVELALELAGNGKLLLQSVQTQAIEPGYLSTDSKTGRRLDQKADFTLSYSHEASDLAALYARLPPRNSAVSHVSDAFTKTTALFSGIEAKPADGDKSEAEYQISIWMGASLLKKAELARMAGLSDITSALIEPAFVVVGHEWYFYLVYLQPTGAVHVLEHGSCSTNSVSGVFKILRVLRNVVEYGLEGFEGGLEAKVGYWGGFLGPVLEKLAAGEERATGNVSAATPGDEVTWIGSTAASHVTI